MKSILSIITAAFVAVGISQAAPINKDCPIQNKAAKGDKTVEYAKKVTFCCEKCKATFDADPKKQIDKIAAYKESDGKCVMTGKKADPAQTSEYKATVGLCCDKCVAKFTATPDKFITKAVK